GGVMVGGGGAAAGGGGAPVPGDPKQAGTTLAAARVELLLSDGSKMKVVLLDERVELETAYGKLLIPVGDIHRIDFGLHIPEEVRKQIDAAITDLGSPVFVQRETATAKLLAWAEKAYPALLKAEKSPDSEVAQRVEA